MRAESAGSFANRRGSSVNGVNEEWEQTKCAEMKEVPPHCIGFCTHIDTTTIMCTHTSFLFFHMYTCYPTLFTTFSAPIDTKHFVFAPPRTCMHILLLSHSSFYTPTPFNVILGTFATM